MMRLLTLSLVVALVVVSLGLSAVPQGRAQAQEADCREFDYVEVGFGNLSYYHEGEFFYAEGVWSQVLFVYYEYVYEEAYEQWVWVYHYHLLTCTGDYDYDFASDECQSDVVKHFWEEHYAFVYEDYDSDIDGQIDLETGEWWIVFWWDYETMTLTYDIYHWSQLVTTHCQIKFRQVAFAQVGLHNGLPGVSAFTMNLDPEWNGVFDLAGNTWLTLPSGDKNLYYAGPVYIMFSDGRMLSFNAVQMGSTYHVYLDSDTATVEVVSGFGAEAAPFESFEVPIQ